MSQADSAVTTTCAVLSLASAVTALIPDNTNDPDFHSAMNAMAYRQASSPEGVALQIALCLEFADQLHDLGPQTAEAEFLYDAIQNALRSIYAHLRPHNSQSPLAEFITPAHWNA